MPKKYVTVNDVATLVHHRGPTTLPQAPPNTSQGATIVCCHDAGTDGTVFEGLLDHLAASQSPLAWDQPGHGRSASLDALDSVDAMVAHLKGLCDHWKLPAPILVGEGLGAAVALQAAARHPDWPRALVVSGGAAASYELDDEIDQLTAITSGKARRDFDRTGYAPDTDRSVYQKAFASWVKTDPRATLGARKAQAAWSLADPAAITVPTMVVVGQHEDDATAGRATELQESLGSATLTIVDGAARRGVLEQPEAMADAISELAANGIGGSGS